ncbi:secretin [Pseudomonas sp. LS1212]|uniref:secretin N-terminal domain-containing protein n=1 Tax=Pseudomonas sp. LS1212 TaxID=2972478 RepID=UPI00215D4ED7|nr:secretin N-terminal domain-containing protein [Pseudomonas sp. LS1212]UVJ45821.1 secretin [Pseudomonas sp. LS1212]
MPLRPLLATLLLSFSLSALAATEIIPLNHRPSAEILPVAQSFLGKDGSVSAYGNQLIVKAEDARKITELRALLEQLDTAPKRLLISVDTNDSNYQDQQANGTRIIRHSTTNRTGGVQQIQASEGSAALIQVGQSIPLTSTQTDTFGRLQSQTEYRNVTQGFYVTASVTGETVHLNISTNNDRMSQERPDVVNVQSTDTNVSGRLGQWITLAGINQQSQADLNSQARQYSTQGRDDMILRVKVDTLD